MSPACPPLVVPAPTVPPHRFGLLSAAQVIETLDPHFECGVEYVTGACADAVAWEDACPPDEVPLAKPEGAQLVTVTGSPIPITAAVDCGLIGASLAEHEARARAALACSEQRALEAAYYSGTIGNTPVLADPACTALNTTITPVTLAAGVGMLEDALGSSYCGEGILHAPRAVGALAARYRQTFGSGGQLRTALGNVWSFGTGYGNTSPAGVAAPAGIVWIYVTGQIVIRRSEVFITPPDPSRGVNTSTNQVQIVAERIYVLTQDPCVCAAIAVSLV